MVLGAGHRTRIKQQSTAHSDQQSSEGGVKPAATIPNQPPRGNKDIIKLVPNMRRAQRMVRMTRPASPRKRSLDRQQRQDAEINGASTLSTPPSPVESLQQCGEEPEQTTVTAARAVKKDMLSPGPDARKPVAGTARAVRAEAGSKGSSKPVNQKSGLADQAALDTSGIHVAVDASAGKASARSVVHLSDHICLWNRARTFACVSYVVLKCSESSLVANQHLIAPFCWSLVS